MEPKLHICVVAINSTKVLLVNIEKFQDNVLIIAQETVFVMMVFVDAIADFL